MIEFLLQGLLFVALAAIGWNVTELVKRRRADK